MAQTLTVFAPGVISGPAFEASPAFTPDGKTVYFSSRRSLPIYFPRTLESAKQDLRRIEEWDNGNTHIWQFLLVEWMKNNPRADSN